MFYKLDLLKEQLNNIAVLTNSSVTVYDANMNTLAYSENFFNLVCRSIQDHSQNLCLMSDNFAKSNIDTTQPHSYTCPAGFTETIIPLIDNNYIYGYCIVGQYRLENNCFPAQFFREFCKKHTISFDQMKENWFSTPVYKQNEVRALISIVTLILRHLRDQSILGCNYSEFFSAVDSFINANLNKRITIENLAKNFHLTKQQLYRVFQDNVHQTVKVYINNKRLDKAKSLILFTETPLSIIAESVGFYNFNYFIKIFKNREHCTPKQFRLISRKTH